ncbi:hypothetical protein [Methanococcoides alaskense]|uniref:Uncharacterized protein n=1 Tax=Methanococcoides alaskense TaxID=325778 RepID=A0AA90ZBY1_9EURY|nr:hypothetical protein [Methanococcoides alaskense]MDA0524575.1 hypothetical protein [Methanococcoides alaskense]MDR6222263.1 hypothetical protein [Methanococcoides alaskense]
MAVIIFGLLSAIVLYLLVNYSSLIAGVVLLGIPLAIMLVIPNAAIEFLNHEHVRLAGGIVPINNYHLLLFTWSTIIGIILYTEFLTWYLSRKKK